MFVPIDLPLCECEDALGRHTLSAVLDVVTLTYHVVERDPSASTGQVRRHLLTLGAARRWATAYRDEQLRRS
jgi:hypothetical protein